MSQEILDILYDAELFPKSFILNRNDKIAEDNLNISDFFVESFRNSDSKVNIDRLRFDETLTTILNGKDKLYKIRAILLIIMMKNYFDVSSVFEILLTEDVLNITNRVGNENESLFISGNRYFNKIFYDELAKHPLLMIDLVEIIRNFVNDYSLDYEVIYPIINNILLANEDSMTPVDSNALVFMNSSHVNSENRKIIDEKYPIILPFELKYREYCQYNASGPTIKIRVNRENVLAAVWSLDDLKDTNFRIRVDFGEGEIDAGGVTTEFIDLAFKTLVKPETGLFDLRNNYYWFKYHPTMTEELKKKYRSVGMLLGIAVSHRRTIPIHFPRYFYKKLLHRKMHITDVNMFDQTVFRTFISLLESSISEDNSLKFTYVDNLHNYAIDLTDFKYIDDDVNFEPKYITDANKNEYIQKVTEWIFDKSVRESFAAFEEGYKRVQTNPMLYRSFTIYEIDNIISGDSKVDWDSLKQGTKYSGGYSKNSQVIQWFWRYFDGLSDEKKFEVLKFITGTTSIPVGGLKNAGIGIRKILRGDFPLAHICFSQMDLPEYSSYEELERRCSEAFPNSLFGFG